jgi:hypothetical protein
MDKFSKDNEIFKQEFENQNNIIVRYDEIISQKTSLHRLFEERKKLEAKYDPLINEIKIFDDEIKFDVDDLANKLENLEKSVELRCATEISKFLYEREKMLAAVDNDMFSNGPGRRNQEPHMMRLI